MANHIPGQNSLKININEDIAAQVKHPTQPKKHKCKHRNCFSFVAVTCSEFTRVPLHHFPPSMDASPKQTSLLTCLISKLLLMLLFRKRKQKHTYSF